MNEAGKILLKSNGNISEVMSYTQQNGFDPMTGQPKMITFVQNGFNPMTGQPVYCPVVSDGFEPMTGQPIYSIKQQNAPSSPSNGSVNPQQISQNTAPVTSQVQKPVKPARNNSKAKIIIPIVIGVVALIAVIVGTLIYTEAFISPQKKILLATYRTVSNDSIGKNIINAADVLSSGEFTTSFDCDFSYGSDSISINGTNAFDLDAAKTYTEGQFEFRGFSQSIQLSTDDEKIRLALPDLLGDVYEYDFTKKNTDGFLADCIESETEGSIEDVNRTLLFAAEYLKNTSKFQKVFKKNLIKALDEFEVESISKDSFTIDGKDRKCKGYQVYLTADGFDAILDAYADASDEVYSDSLSSLAKSVGNLLGEDIDLSFDNIQQNLKGELDFLEDVDIEVYLYKKELAAIRLSENGNVLTFEFQGGDTRTSNILITVKQGDSRFKIVKKSSIKGSVESGYIKIDGEELEYSYNTKSGSFEIDGGLDIPNISFNTKGDTISFEIKDPGYFGLSYKLKATISQGAKNSAIKGRAIDIGDLSERECESIVRDIVGQFGDLDLIY